MGVSLSVRLLVSIPPLARARARVCVLCGQAYENGTLLDKLQFFVFEGLDVASQNPVAAVATAAVLVVSMLWCCVMGSGKQESPIVGSDDEEEEDDEGDAASDADAGNASEEEEEDDVE